MLLLNRFPSFHLCYAVDIIPSLSGAGITSSLSEGLRSCCLRFIIPCGPSWSDAMLRNDVFVKSGYHLSVWYLSCSVILIPSVCSYSMSCDHLLRIFFALPLLSHMPALHSHLCCIIPTFRSISWLCLHIELF